MLLTFWVHGRGIGEEEPLGWVKRWYRTALGWGRDAGEWVGVVPPASEEVSATASAHTHVQSAGGPSGSSSDVGSSSGSSFLGGIFGGLGLRGGSAARKDTRGLPPPGTYKVGEVHGDYVKVN
jgi:hypothetical protein